MNGVLWKRLELTGFGVFDNLELELEAGLSAFVAPNESGKSTAVAGLSAVMFGLPAGGGKTAWSRERYRSHRGLTRFEGLCDFRALDGESYRLWRNFDTHHVRLLRKTAEGYRSVFEGEHNPSAKKGTGRYEAQLEKLVGVVSYELFNSLFSVRQPLSGAHQLSQEVAGLLAGSGGGSSQDALKALEEQITQRTKFTRQYGLPGSNKSKNRDLEELEGELERLRTEIREGAAAADGLQSVQKELLQATEDERRLHTEVERFRSAAAAAVRWLAAKEGYDREQREYSSLKGKLDAVRELEREIRGLEEAAPLSESAERDWGFVEGRALTYVQGHRDDAPAALREYEHLQSIQSKLREHERERERFELLHSASEAALAELSDSAAIHSRLEEELKRALGELERAGAQTEARSGAGFGDAGFEDVAQLSPTQLDELQQAAKPPAPVALLFSGGGLATGVLFGFALGLGTQTSVVLGAVLAALGFFVGKRLNSAKRAAHVEAQATLERYATWQARRASPSPSPVDQEALELRVNEAQRALDTLSERVAPYKQAYADVKEAVSAYKKASDGVARCSDDAEGTAQRIWGVSAGEVDTLEPAFLGGHWQRLSSFVSVLDRSADSVRALHHTLVAFSKDNTWEALSRDAQVWDAQRVQQQKRTDDSRTRQDTLAGLLRGESAASAAELSDQVETQHTAAVSALGALQRVCDAHPELPRHDDPTASRETLSQTRRQAATKFEQRQSDLENVKATVHELRGQQAEAQSRQPVNIAAKEVDLRELVERKAELEAEIAAYTLAYSTLKDAVHEYQDTYLGRLSESTSVYFTAFTRGQATEDTRQVDFSADFSTRITEQNGITLESGQLSQGGQDQLALAVRLAVADMISNNLSLPLVFDDPFQNCDKDRLANIRSALTKIAETRQVLILSHEESYLTWGETVAIS